MVANERSQLPDKYPARFVACCIMNTLEEDDGIMALKTFHNLPETRQKEIFLVCLEEFAHNDYESVSLTRIIIKLGLAKGSFYRYFENKKQLYIYLVEECRKINAEEIEQNYMQPDLDFFAALVNGFITMLKTEQEYPHYLAFNYRVITDRKYAVFGNLANKWKKERYEALKKVIRQHQERGNIRKDIAIELIVQCVNVLILGMREYFFYKYFPAVKSTRSQNTPVLPETEIRTELEDFIKIIKRGIMQDQTVNGKSGR